MLNISMLTLRSSMLMPTLRSSMLMLTLRCCVVYQCQRGQRSLTGPAMGGGGGFIFPAPGADQHCVESAGHQAIKHTLVLRLENRLVLQEHVVVFDKHLVEVEVSGSVTPVHLQVVIPSGMGRCRVLDLCRL